MVEKITLFPKKYFSIYVLIWTAIFVIIFLYSAYDGIYNLEIIKNEKLIHEEIFTPTALDYLNAIILNQNHIWFASEAAVGAALSFVYFLPSFIGELRKHHDSFLIFLANLVVGWTVIGWLASLIFSLSPVRGVRAIAEGVTQSAAPRLMKLKEDASALAENIQDHPIAREATHRADRLLGGRWRRYDPPPEGTQSLISQIAVSRNLEGAIQLRAGLYLPVGTQIQLSVLEHPSQVRQALTQIRLAPGGRLEIASLTREGRPFPGGTYMLRIATLPFEFGTQDEWILDAVGEHGKLLPHSATVPVDPEFPHYGRKLLEERTLTFPEIAEETMKIETVKTSILSNDGSQASSVEEHLRDRFASRPDEMVAPGDAWQVEQIGPSRWIVRLAFTRRGRPQLARWEVDPENVVRCMDPDAKAMSGLA